MRVNVYPFPSAVSEKQYYNSTVIVVDLLRASTSMVTALDHGAIQLIPARDAGEAIAFAAHLGRKESLLAGERGGLKMQGFDLGNSPLEQTRAAINEKTVVFCTTNGTGAIHAARSAQNLLIGCLRNRAAVASYALSLGCDILILCAGTAGECSIDDMVAAGGIFKALIEGLEEPPEANDFASACEFMYEEWRKGAFAMAKAAHYRVLKGLHFDEDLVYCLAPDQTDCVPKYENGSIRKVKP